MNSNGNKMTFNDWVSSQPDYLSIFDSIMKRKKVDLVNMIMIERYENAYTVGHNLQLEEKVSEAEGMYELSQLKKSVFKLHTGITLHGTPSEVVGHLDRHIEDMSQELKELKEELLHEQQKGTSIDTEAMDELVNIFDEKIASCDIPEEVKKLKESIEELKLKLTKVPKKTMNYEKMMNMEKENEELKEEIEKLKQYEGIHKAIVDCNERSEEYLMKQIKELKEENEKYKQYEQHEETILSSLNFYTEQCEELKEERKELKESIEKKDKQIALLVNNKKKREQQVIRMKKICEEKIEDVPEE